MRCRKIAIPALLAGAFVCATLAFVLYLRPSIINDYLNIDRSLFFIHARFTAPLPTLLGAQPWQSIPLYCVVLTVSLSLLLVFYKFLKHRPLAQQLIEVSPLTFLFIPYCWVHDFIILLPWMTLVFREALHDRLLLGRALFCMGAGWWLVGDWFLWKDPISGAPLSRYPHIYAIISFIFLRILYLTRSDVSEARL